MKRVWDFFVNREWAMVVSVVGAVLVSAEAVAEDISEQAVGAGDYSWHALAFIVAGAVIRGAGSFGVWSKKAVAESNAEAVELKQAGL